MRRMKKAKKDADLDITSFMNLMIVLVPVLLLNMVFTQTMVLDIKLPADVENAITPKDKEAKFDFELMVLESGLLFNVNKAPICKFEKVDGQYDFKGLSKTLQLWKSIAEQKFNENKAEDAEYRPKKDILLLLGEKQNYQTIVSMMDTLRSYPIVVSGAVEHAELMPDVSFGDLPEGAEQAFAAVEARKGDARKGVCE
ncbi:MAG: biopolymer transporter ExbD [Pseudomonadales bacterium]|nr:biopolymer transporter ExbD [Pseudomonadales bacterium]